MDPLDRTIPLVAPQLVPRDAVVATIRRAPASDHVSTLDVLAYVAAVVGHHAEVRPDGDGLAAGGQHVPITADPALWDRAQVLGREVLWASTFGRLAADTHAGRPFRGTALPADDPRRPRMLTTPTWVPDGLAFDAADRRLTVDTGSWSNVDQAAADYRVGARNVLASWLADRKGDDDRQRHWPAAWTEELVALLDVVTRLVHLYEPRVALLTDMAAAAAGAARAPARRPAGLPAPRVA